MSILPIKVSPENLQAELTRLWHREAFFDATQRIAHFGYCEWDYANDRIKSCTREYAQIFLMTIDEVIESQSSWEKVLLQIHPDDRQLYEDSYRQNLGAGSHEIEYRILRRDGEIRHIEEIGVVVYDEAGGITGTVGLLQDFTERQQREQELEYRDAMVRKIETITDVGYFIWDLQAEIYTYISPGFARIYGMTVAEYLQRIESIDDALADVHEEDRELLQDAYRRRLKEKKDFTAEYRITRKDGQLRWIREQGTVVEGATSRTRQSIGILQDITGQMNVERSLRDAKDSLETIVADRTLKLADTIEMLKMEMTEREKISIELGNQNAELERFAYTVSHDLKTPLVTIKGFVGLLGKDIAENNRQRIANDFEKINSAADMMEKLLSDLLGLGRVGRVIGEAEICDLSEIAAKAIDMVESSLRARQIEIVVEDLPSVMGDPTRLLEVFLNLLENAIKFIGDQAQPRVHIGTLERDGMVCCFVQDNGIGIEGDYHDHVFGLFERLDAKIDGTGVGLALVKRIIEVHGGEIWVESDGLGQGSRFLFTLPG
jgi:PAS domain S-box-containing protein